MLDRRYPISRYTTAAPANHAVSLVCRGFGLTLTGADVVIFIEHDWNPQRDLQVGARHLLPPSPPSPPSRYIHVVPLFARFLTFRSSRHSKAMDRAHRIGQTRPVNVYRLLMRGTLEEQIMGLQQFKIGIAHAVVNEDNSTSGDAPVLESLESSISGANATDGAKANRKRR